jgi:hypothetical protein
MRLCRSVCSLASHPMMMAIANNASQRDTERMVAKIKSQRSGRKAEVVCNNSPVAAPRTRVCLKKPARKHVQHRKRGSASQKSNATFSEQRASNFQTSLRPIAADGSTHPVDRSRPQYTLDPTKGIEGAIVIQDWTDAAPAPSVNPLPDAEVDRASTPRRPPADQQGSTSAPPARNCLSKDGDIVNEPPGGGGGGKMHFAPPDGGRSNTSYAPPAVRETSSRQLMADANTRGKRRRHRRMTSSRRSTRKLGRSSCRLRNSRGSGSNCRNIRYLARRKWRRNSHCSASWPG